tara:strand:- start:63 stop:545 length:483 start_codon:yes stop_codon:yes gene_type:complete
MNTKEISQKVWQDPIYFLAFGFGSGLMKKAPGTWGTVAAIPVFLLMYQLPAWLYLIMTIIFFIMGVYICEVVSKGLGIHDYKGIVWDEVVGFLITMFLAPEGLFWLLMGFILFRFFDILKPEPIKSCDKKVMGGLGVMLDDVIAGVMAFILLQIFAWVLS